MINVTRMPEYSVWTGMKMRCFNPKRAAYKNYGGRGITICDRWKDNFQAFLQDMGPRPSDDHTIERKDNDGNYEPSNCVWLPSAEQANNRRRKSRNPKNARRFLVHGKSMTTADIEMAYGVKPQVFNGRIRKGWTTEQAVADTETALLVTNKAKSLGKREWWNQRQAYHVVNGVSMSTCEVVDRFTIKRNTFLKRLRLGWSPDKAATEPAA